MRRLLLTLAILLAFAHPAAAGFYDLLNAARLNDTAAARELLVAGTEPNGGPSGFPDSYSPLQWAARHGNTELIALLLEAGADTERRDFNGDRPLLWAARAGQAGAIRALVAAGSPVSSDADPSGNAPLMLAARSGSADALRALIDAGAWLDFGKQGGAALREATLAQAQDAVRVLLDAGADPDFADSILSETALHIAAARADITIVEALLAAGADLSLRDGDGHAALDIAAFRGLPEAVAALLAAGADPQQPDAGGRLPLMAAIDGKSFEWRDNDAAGALLAAVTPDPDAAFIAALAAQMPRTASVLLARGADPNRVEAGRSALALAAALEDPATMLALLEAGADLSRFGPEALGAAAASGRLAAAHHLLDSGVPIDAPDPVGRTPLHHAAQAGQVEMVRVLLAAGAAPVPPGSIEIVPPPAPDPDGLHKPYVDLRDIELAAAMDALRDRQREARAILAAAIAGL